ncbi:MAG: hypothetical protein ACFFBW_12560 [Promethearchaeota archaeon]
MTPRLLENEKLKRILLIIFAIALIISFVLIIIYIIDIFAPDTTNGDG